MSDPNMDAADAYTSWQAETYKTFMDETDKAISDAENLGIGFVRFLPGGRCERLRPDQVLIKNDSDKNERPDAD